MADKRDYYEVLGVDKNADDAASKNEAEATRMTIAESIIIVHNLRL